MRFSFFYICIAIVLHSFFATAEVVDKVVAIVNNEVILESDLTELRTKINNSTMVDDLLLSNFSPEEIRKNRKTAISFLVSEKILESEIKKLNLTVTQERVDQEIKNIAKMNRISKDDLLSEIQKQGLKVSDYQDLLKTRIERQSLIESEVTSKIHVSDEDVLALYLSKNPKAPSLTYEFKLAHIFFNPKKSGGAPAAEERAKKVLQKLGSDKNFESLAEQNSEDPNFSNGGLFGSFKTGELAPEMENAIQDLEVGQNSKIVKSKIGFHIFKLLSKKTVTDPEFERQKEKIRAELKEKAFKKHFSVWLENKKEEAFIKINEI